MTWWPSPGVGVLVLMISALVFAWRFSQEKKMKVERTTAPPSRTRTTIIKYIAAGVAASASAFLVVVAVLVATTTGVARVVTDTLRIALKYGPYALFGLAVLWLARRVLL